MALIAATPRTGVVAQPVVRWVALLRFLGSGSNPGIVIFFYILHRF